MENANGATERRKLEMVQETLQQYMEERKVNSATGSKEREEILEEDLFLSRLLSKLDSVKITPELNDLTPAIPVNKHENCSDPSSSEQQKEEVTSLKEIEKDIKVIKKQNRITHRLLSALIILTMAWQFGEISFFLAVKDKVTHPVRSVGDMIKSALTGKEKKPSIEGALVPVPQLGAPELTNGNSLLLAPTNRN
ncbi:hypothetical protein LUZ61_000980 [Rhynchospora tenuis]|uniref:Uncharacterized protein n=1 Tax=Rhynchospora tenuis TaxID=198213 RepID=A0AAD5ZG90_9POAL|nr:hypothetical protein LUZ61_000980 [Rhynchospora tenuis]